MNENLGRIGPVWVLGGSWVGPEWVMGGTWANLFEDCCGRGRGVKYFLVAAHTGENPSENQPIVIIQNFFNRNDPYIMLIQNFENVVLG